jgi:uncharacterized protein
VASETGASASSALLAFRAGNVRSFRDPFELSLVASTMAEKAVVRRMPWREGKHTIGVLPVAGVFGANGSGKSAVLKAMDDMRSLVASSFRDARPGRPVRRRPFLLDPAALPSPTTFEVDLVLDGVRHEYGFAVDDGRVLDEWCYRFPHGRNALLFRRSGDDIKFGPAPSVTLRAIADLLRPNALFLSAAAAANHPGFVTLAGWFEHNLMLAEAGSRSARQVQTRLLLADAGSRAQVLALLQAADLGVTGAADLDAQPVPVVSAADEGDDEEAPAFDELGVALIHRGVGGDVELPPQDESLGTQIWFGLIGPVVEALARGTVFLADELDASLHPALVAHIVRLFQDPETNPHGAQLVFNSHDASLLGDSTGERLLGRDQIWFTEKHPDGSTHLYPLTDLDPRKEEAVGRRYLDGRYGATPILSRGEFAAVADMITAGRGA